jgi:hypothetical protein
MTELVRQPQATAPRATTFAFRDGLATVWEVVSDVTPGHYAVPTEMLAILNRLLRARPIRAPFCALGP